MYKSHFGNRGQISFSSPNEYYELLGYLAKSDGTTAISWEHNEDQGAWGSEGRICFYEDHIPLSCHLKLTRGNGSIAYRVNCNDFVGHIVSYHAFREGKHQNISAIRATIPAAFVPDFNTGLSK